LKLSLVALLALSLLAETAEAGNLQRWLRLPEKKASEYQAQNAPPILAFPGWQKRSNQGVVRTHVNEYGFGKPAFAWGYFGANPNPTITVRKGSYYNEHSQWQFRRGR
jgi:hypothetical protein